MDTMRLNIDDDAQLDELMDLVSAVHTHDQPGLPPPCRVGFPIMERYPNPDRRSGYRLAHRDGRLIGAMQWRLPQRENRNILEAGVMVHPAERRQGIGARLLATAIDFAREHKRDLLTTVVMSSIPGGEPWSDAGTRFCAEHGFTAALPIVEQRLDLTAIDLSAEKRLFDECAEIAGGYELLGWNGATPDEHATEIARLASRIGTDAPSGDLNREAEQFDVARLHRQENRRLAAGQSLTTVAVRHRAGGTLAAYTQVSSTATTGGFGEIPITLVDPQHRGHRLGTLAKIDIHRRLRRDRPGLRYLITGNAEINSHMIAINAKLGFKPIGKVCVHQRKL